MPLREGSEENLVFSLTLRMHCLAVQHLIHNLAGIGTRECLAFGLISLLS